MEQIKNEILQKLRDTEQNYQVKIPLAIESGSRGWGFAAHNADYDCRFIYVHTKDWYLSILNKKDYIECASDAVFDVNGWDLKKVLTHIIKSNAVMFEWLSSNEIYIKDDTVVKLLQNLSDTFFNPIATSYHYLNTAKNKLTEILYADNAKIKKYFYALRPLTNLQYIHQYGKMPPMEYEKTLSAIEAPAEIVTAIKELIEEKRQANEHDLIPRNKQLVSYIKNEVELFTERLKVMQFEKCRDYEAVDTVFRNIIEMMWNNA